MKIHKQCGLCGKVHTEIPADARPWNERGLIIGYVWECSCGSTLFKAVNEVIRNSIVKEGKLGK